MNGMNGMDGGDNSGFVPLSPDGVDFSNETQAYNFLQDILADDYFQVEANAFARYFWYSVTVSVVAIMIYSAFQTLLLRYSSRSPKLISTPFNTFTAIFRECTVLQFTPRSLSHLVQLPPMGSVCLILLYLGLIAFMEVYDNNYPGAQHYQAYGLRAAWLAVAQVPLIVLLAGKNNIIGLLTGVNYQRLNVLHRWVARGLLVLSTLHFAFQSVGWDRHGLRTLEWRTDTCPPTGMAAYAILLWINFMNLYPVRQLSYAFFLAQHILMFFGFIIALMFHIPSTALYSRIYVWIGIGIYVFDRLTRSIWTVWHNRSLAQAQIESLDGMAVRITIPNTHFKKWSPGSHVRLYVPRFGSVQSHPATIMSTPKSHNGDLVLTLKAHRGFTRRLLRSAMTTSEVSSASVSSAERQPTHTSHKCVIDGPYRSSQLDLWPFEVVLLVAGGSGMTYCLSNFLSLAERATTGKQIPKVVEFVWIMKNESQLKWVEDELISAFNLLQRYGCRVSCTIYVTKRMSEKQSQVVIDASSSTGQICLSTNGKKKYLIVSRGIEGERLIQIHYGRPDIGALLLSSIEKATTGQTAIAACGPLELTRTIRNQYCKISDDRAICKGTGARPVYLHVENQ